MFNPQELILFSHFSSKENKNKLCKFLHIDKIRRFTRFGNPAWSLKWSFLMWKLLNVITFTKGYWAKLFSYCYHSVNNITFRKYFFWWAPFGCLYFLSFKLLNEPELGAGIDPGMSLTPLPSSIGWDLNPQPSNCE